LSLYEEFIAAHGGVFNSSTWREHVHGDSLHYYGIFTDRGELCAVFHLYAQTRYGLTFIRNPPFMPHAGLVINNRAQNGANYLSFNKDALSAFADLLDELSYSVLSIALPPSVVDTQPFYWNKYKVIPNYTYQLDLSEADADLEKQFASNVRNSIKKAAKDGVSIELCHDYAVVKQLVKTTFSRREKALDEGTVDAILQNFANPQNSFALVAHWENKPVAVAFCVHDNTVCYYLFGGYDHTSTHRGAGVLCLYNCLLHAQILGLKVFDFEGSMMPEVESYFRSFGPRLVPYYTINKGRLPFELVLKFVKRERF
jgi:lipid II:glycine glycyltransferase (peptidoglycan interpeptide bridge formation enzyme)